MSAVAHLSERIKADIGPTNRKSIGMTRSPHALNKNPKDLEVHCLLATNRPTRDRGASPPQNNNHNHNSIATNDLNPRGGKIARGVAGEGASGLRSANRKNHRVSPIGIADLKTRIQMSQVSSERSRTQSPSSTAFPSYFRRERNTLAVESLPELPNSGGSPSEQNLEENGRDSRGEVSSKRKDAVYYAPIPEKQKLGYLSTAALIINKMIGTGIFSKPSAILRQTGSKGGALFLWATGGVMTLTG